MLGEELFPNWLVEGLIETGEDEEQKKHGGPENLWRKVEVGDKSVIIRSAKKRSAIPIRRVP